MSRIAPLFPAIVVAYGCAAAVVLLRSRFGGRPAFLATWMLVPAVLLSPLLIPPANVGLRAAAAVIAADVAFKVVDARRRRRDRRDPPPRLRDDYALLVPFPVFAVVAPDHRRRRLHRADPGPDVGRLALGTAGVVGAVLATMGLANVAAIRSSFALDHAAMLVLFVAAIESLARALCGLERLAGCDTTPIVRDIYRARTVAEFWRRYNDRVHDWLYRNIFLPTGGRRAPARSVVLVFVASGLFHELMFGIATSRFTGYQLAFFALQAPAAIASGHLERLARRGGLAGKLVAHATTIGFLAVTSVLFFDGVRRVFPFIYASRSPLP